MTPESNQRDDAPYRIDLGRDEGWDVVREGPQHTAVSTHCTDWHRVERLCAALDRQKRESPLTTAPDRT